MYKKVKLWVMARSREKKLAQFYSGYVGGRDAVIEHVGDRAAQLAFLNEMLRVAKNVFFTTPNKWFPLESHTNVLMLHYFPDSFYRWCAKRDMYWTPETLNLLDGAALAELLSRSNARASRVIRNRLGGLTMTYSVVCSARSAGT